MLAIHHREGSFSDKWIEYCEINHINYKLVDCYSTNIINELKECNALMWHWHHNDIKAQIFARQFIFSVKAMGLKIFPNFETCWHFDDKVGQKYLFEAIGAPLITTNIFYDLRSTLKWIENNEFPKVFKLRGGAGAENVKLLHNKTTAKKYAKKAFSSGFGLNRFAALQERLWHFKRDKSINSFINITKGVGRIFLPNKIKQSQPIEKNYMYIQDFIPNNDSDIRVITIGKRAFAIKRMVRDGDFRASGSGNIVYDRKEIPLDCIRIAFETSNKIKSQCAAYDFVFLEGNPMIIEISYAFSQEGYLRCSGYWNENLNWIEGSFTPEYFMIEDILNLNNNGINI